MARLPFRPPAPAAVPPVVDRASWQSAREDLLTREKSHTREGDAIAAARRRLPMTPVPADATVVGPDGEIPFVDAFEGRSQLVGYFHMWHPGRSWEEQCPVCTFSAAELGRPEYLHLRDITLALFCEGSYEESRPYADFVHAELPWYSAAASPGLVAGRGFGFFGCFLRVGDQAYETYWTTDRGNEAPSWSYVLMDRTVYGRQEPWEDSPPGWPQHVGQRHETFGVAGRPAIQWHYLDEPDRQQPSR